MAARAALMATPIQLARMRRRGRADGERSSTIPTRTSRSTWRSTARLAAATGNVVLAFVLDSVRELLRVSRQRSNLISELPEATRSHRQIYEAILAREPETARQAMRAHLLSVTRAWGVDLDGPRPGASR